MEFTSSATSGTGRHTQTLNIEQSQVVFKVISGQLTTTVASVESTIGSRVEDHSRWDRRILSSKYSGDTVYDRGEDQLN